MAGCDVLHSHTWYANVAGVLGGLLHGVPHVLTAHSLEPQRPWKIEQLGGGYRVSSWAERTAYRNADAVIAVSNGMKSDILAVYPFMDPDKVHVVHNGIDTVLYAPDPHRRAGALRRRPRPAVRGLRRADHPTEGRRAPAGGGQSFVPEAQLVLCAGAPDTPEIGAATAAAVDALQETRDRRGLDLRDAARARTWSSCSPHATLFVCPSVYEPLGIVNLEAMACETAVVASAVGGIPEVVDDGKTGLLVPYTTAYPEGFEAALAEAVNALVTDPGRAKEMGRAGRARAEREFGWDAIARRTVEVYGSLR